MNLKKKNNMNDLKKNLSEEDKIIYNTIVNEIIERGFSYVSKSLHRDADINPAYVDEIYNDLYERYKTKNYVLNKNVVHENTTLLIKHFEYMEEYDKCGELLTLKNNV